MNVDTLTLQATAAFVLVGLSVIGYLRQHARRLQA